MAKKGGMDLGTLLIYGVGAYFVYTNWSSIPAWFSNLTTPAATAATPVVSPTMAPTPISSTPVSPDQVLAPSSAGTLVPLAPTQSAPQSIATMPPTPTQPGPALTVATPLTSPGTDFIIMRPRALPIFRVVSESGQPQLIPPATPAATSS